jgi:class 3 adenylate cyclase
METSNGDAVSQQSGQTTEQSVLAITWRRFGGARSGNAAKVTTITERHDHPVYQGMALSPVAESILLSNALSAFAVPRRLASMDSIAPADNSGGERRLAAILAADIRGYSQLVGRDEEATVARVTRQLSTIAVPTVERHGGRIFKMVGDGFLATFNSSLDAVRCALAFQKRVAEEDTELPSEKRLQYRIGIHVGDVIAAGDDYYGDSVNIAARIQTAAAAGGICVSGSVYVQIKNKLPCRYTSLGDKRFKNIADPVPVYSVTDGASAAPSARLRRAIAAGVATAALAGAGWTAWANRTVLRHGAESLGIVSLASSTPSAVDERRAAVFRRMVAAMQNDRFSWRTIDRLAIESGVSEAEAHEILAAHPGEVVLGKSRDGKLIARLSEH